MIKLGKIQNSASTSDVVKKPFVAYGKKRKRETNVVQSYSTLLVTRIFGVFKGARATSNGPSSCYDNNVWIEFHSSALGHSIENYKALKYKVDDLIDSKAITFTHNSPNVNNNPMPPYNKPTVNMVEFDNGRRLMSCVDELKTRLIEIKNVLMKNDAFPVYSITCEHYLNNTQQCETLKSAMQRLMDQGIFVINLPSIIEDVSTLEIPYNQIPPLFIPYD